MTDYEENIANYESRCRDLPDIVCQSCDMLEHETNIKFPNDKLKHIENDAWKDFKTMLHIEN